MRVLIILLSIRYNVCVCHSPVYHYITATTVYLIQRFITTCVVVKRLYLSRTNSFYKKLKNVSCEYDRVNG